MTESDLAPIYDKARMEYVDPRAGHAAGLRAVVVRARAEALEEAAEECDALASVEGIAQRCAAAIRARAAEGSERG